MSPFRSSVLPSSSGQSNEAEAEHSTELWCQIYQAHGVTLHMATSVCSHAIASLWTRHHSIAPHATVTNKEHSMNLYGHEELKSYRRSPVRSACPSHQLLIQSDRASQCEPLTIGPDCSQYHCNYAAPTVNFTHQRPWSGLGVPALVQSTG